MGKRAIALHRDTGIELQGLAGHAIASVKGAACAVDGGAARATLHCDVLQTGGVEVPGAIVLVDGHVAGQTQAMFPTLYAAMPYLKSNRVIALAVTGQKRSAAEPSIPTFKELGYNGFDGQQWYGISGPANLPDPIVKKLNAELNKVLATPEFSDQMASEAMTLMPMSPDQFSTYIKEDIARWSKVAKDRNIEID